MPTRTGTIGVSLFPGFGDPHARVFVVGLAPGAHGSNRTGRQFTGDASGNFLYPALFRAGFANQPESTHQEDGLVLTDLYTAPVCRCAPPENKPSQQEMLNCQPYLVRELAIIKPRVIVVLGRIAFDSIVRIYSVRNSGWKFSHAAQFHLPDRRLVVMFLSSQSTEHIDRKIEPCPCLIKFGSRRGRSWKNNEISNSLYSDPFK